MADPTKALSDQVYAAVAARRLQWDAMLWQVPTLSLTAQAFLMTIALGSETSRTARFIAAFLSFAVALATLQLFARTRWSEITDAHLLETRERATNQRVVHGTAYRAIRDAEIENGQKEHLVRWFASWPSYIVWMSLLGAFGLMSAAVFVLNIVCPSLLDG